jgi:hypothetical protein
MTLSAFKKNLGVSQGRIPSTTAPAGSYVFELGDANSGIDDITVGDYSQVVQSVTFASYDLLMTVTAVVTEPNVSNATIAWDLIGKIASTTIYTRRLTFQGRTLTLSDIALSLTGQSSPVDVTFRLEAVTP